MRDSIYGFEILIFFTFKVTKNGYRNEGEYEVRKEVNEYY